MRPDVLLAIVFVPMLVEAWLARRNERAQRAAGGVEPRGDVYPVMAVVYPVSFLAMIGEGAVRGVAPHARVAVGVTAFLLGKALKWWAIVSLGQAWTFRVLVVPGAARVTRGPYRFIRHPNYLGVVGELAGVALMAGAQIAGPIATGVFGLLMIRRVQVERSALDAILPHPHSTDSTS